MAVYLSSFKSILLYFNESITQENFHTLDLFFTSEKNSYGIGDSWWVNGKVMKTHIEKGMYKAIELKPEQYNYIATDNKCSYQSFYECISQFIAANFKGSPSKCSLMSLPSLEICKINISIEVEQEFRSTYATAVELCPKKLCITLQYNGEETYYKKLRNKNITVQLGYSIPSNLKTLREEYLICDAITMVGSVGGTLGMCIGFSFSGMISFLINLMQNVIVLVKAKFLKSKSLNGSLRQWKLKFPKSRIDKRNEHLHMENNFKIENFMEDQIQKKIEEKLNSLEEHSNIKNETYPKYWLDLKTKVDEISNKVKIVEMKKYK